MDHSQLICHECRHAPRVALPKGLLTAKLPPPLVWNWFTDNRQVSILNLSLVGLGIESEKPICGALILRLKTDTLCYQIHGDICHQKATQGGFYYGVNCEGENGPLAELLTQLRNQKLDFV